jgi:hypothetical protein
MKVIAKKNFLLSYDPDKQESKYCVEGEAYEISKEQFHSLGAPYFEIVKEEEAKSESKAEKPAKKK